MYGDKPLEGSFYTDLKLLDKRLDCYLDTTLKTKDPLYVVTYDRPHRSAVIIYVVHDGNLGYRYPDVRDLKALHDSDQNRFSLKERLDKQAKLMEEARELHERKTDEALRDARKDNKYQFRNLYSQIVEGSAKGHKHVRRIEPKSRGYKVIDKRRVD